MREDGDGDWLGTTKCSIGSDVTLVVRAIQLWAATDRFFVRKWKTGESGTGLTATRRELLYECCSLVNVSTSRSSPGWGAWWCQYIDLALLFATVNVIACHPQISCYALNIAQQMNKSSCMTSFFHQHLSGSLPVAMSERHKLGLRSASVLLLIFVTAADIQNGPWSACLFRHGFTQLSFQIQADAHTLILSRKKQFLNTISPFCWENHLCYHHVQQESVILCTGRKMKRHLSIQCLYVIEQTQCYCPIMCHWNSGALL